MAFRAIPVPADGVHDLEVRLGPAAVVEVVNRSEQPCGAELRWNGRSLRALERDLVPGETHTWHLPAGEIEVLRTTHHWFDSPLRSQTLRLEAGQTRRLEWWDR